VDSKRKKVVKQKEVPKGKFIAQGGDPERYYTEYPAWTFVCKLSKVIRKKIKLMA